MRRLLEGLLCIVAVPAVAQTSPWSVHIGPGFVMLHVKAQPEAPPGTPVPGAGLDADNGTTLGLEVGYSVTPELTARLTVGIPVKTDVSASGSVAAIGKVGDVTYGPGVLSATWTFRKFGVFRPYAGAGAAYLKVFSTHDAGVTDFRVGNAWGSVLQLGTDVDTGSRVGLFLDVKKIYLKTNVAGNVPALGGTPASARARVDPLVVHAGLSYRF